ncbi:E3 ubiquitin-protein ligase TRIM33-like isoform X2 [Dendronephthya gigantea]|uniref:E3 ubiquitin-protein ligase TRIM33-like isoform X2 n=1 Tax=Dendronephthya gigantea TaxID=151771 RepID=UPI0010694CB7|nr:E3 ubiquitin-protein ligase TRIM33-like isoform X2 [Dendronephthya gigantea]
MEALLTCSVCKKLLDEPKTLSCFHSFCKKCLAGYIATEREKAQKKPGARDRLNCPRCRTKFEPEESDGRERTAPANCFINNMLEIQQQTPGFSCESCEAQRPVTCRCIECERFLCEDCLKTHNNWQDFEQHVVLTLEELTKPENQNKAKNKPGLCQKKGHGNKPYEFYCDTCQELACINCVLLDQSGPGHNCQSTDILAEEKKKSLKTTFDILQKTSGEVKSSLEEIDQATKDLDRNTKSAKDLVEEQKKAILQELTTRVEEKTDILLCRIDKKYQHVKQKLLEQSDEVNAYNERVNGSLDFAKNVIEKANNEEIVLLCAKIQASTDDIKKECPEMMEPIHDGGIEYQPEPIETVLCDVKLNVLGNMDCSHWRLDDPVLQSLCDGSYILDKNIEHAKQLVEWMEDKRFGWHLRYRASRDGWEAEKFHKKCDNVGHTLTLVKCGTNIFGGFTDQSWEAQDNMRAFKCPIKRNQKEKAICCNRNWEVVFGGGHDLYISPNASMNKHSYSNLGVTYQLPFGYKPGTSKARSLLAGSEEFLPSEIEVFSRRRLSTMTRCQTTTP